MSNAKNCIPVTSVSEFTSLYSKLVIKAVSKGLPVSKLHAVFLWGAPGVGKSQGVKELAALIEAGTGKKVAVTDVRLLLMNPVDLHGLPTASKDKTKAVWLRPKIFDMDPSEDTLNILFLDELSAAPSSVQAAAYQLVLDRKIGEHALPDNTIVLGAGNRVTDHSVAYRMPKALANRFSHFEISCDYDSWNKWAMENGINPLVINYLGFDTEKLLAERQDEETAYPTPRTWEFVSDLLNVIDEDDIKSYYPMIASYIGNSAASEFLSFVNSYAELPGIASILNGERPVCPKSPDARYILVSSIGTYVLCRARLGVSKDEYENMASYVSQLPSDYVANLYMRLISEGNLLARLLECPSFVDWTEQYPEVYRKICEAA